MELWSCLRKQQKLVEQISEYGVNKVFGENKQCVIYFYFKKVKKKMVIVENGAGSEPLKGINFKLSASGAMREYILL